MMNRKTAKIIAAAVAGLLVLLMLVSVIASCFEYAGATSRVGTLEQRLSEIQDRKAAVQKEIGSINNQIGEVQQKKQAIDQQIALTQDEITTTKTLVSQLETQIQAEDKSLQAAEKALNGKAELFKTRVRVMYEEGNASYLDVLLHSANLEDMMSRIEVVGQIMSYDKTVVKEYTDARNEIAQKKLELQQDKAQQLDYADGLKSKYQELASQKAAQQQLIQGLNVNLAAKQAESDKIDDESNSINDEIAALSRQGAASSSSGGGTGTTPSSGTFTWPLPGYSDITSSYGYRVHPISGTRKFHVGVDIGAPTGTSIVAARGGTVVRSYLSSSYGNYTVIDHGGGVMTAYAHQSKRLVSVGDHVSSGQVIGKVGSTGNSTGSHLHFEVYVGGSTVNPMNYF